MIIAIASSGKKRKNDCLLGDDNSCVMGSLEIEEITLFPIAGVVSRVCACLWRRERWCCAGSEIGRSTANACEKGIARSQRCDGACGLVYTTPIYLSIRRTCLYDEFV
jgi:hypothetical protein